MFGDPVCNPKGWEKVSLSDIAELKIGPFGSLLHKEDYCDYQHPVINPSHIIDGKIIVDNNLTVTNDKYEELYAYHLKIGDVILGRRGEMGRCAVVESDNMLCGTGSLFIRPFGELRADFIQKIISFPTFKKTIEDMAVGQTMPNLNVPIVSNFQIIKPPIEVQASYYDFVAQVDKSKLVAQKSLKLLERIVNCKQEVLLTERRVRMNTGIKPQVLQEICELAVKYGVEQVILFGSRARGDHWAKSDIDLAIRGGDGVRFALDVEAHASTLLTFDIVDLNEAIAPELRDSIAREGVVLYEKV